MTPVDKVKKNAWYSVNLTPPARNEPLGRLFLLLWLEGKPQPGKYSHEEKKFYVFAHKYAPSTKRNMVIDTDVAGINNALTWQEIETTEAKAWMLVEVPHELLGE